MVTIRSSEVPSVPPQYGFGIRLTHTSLDRARVELAAALAAEGFAIVSDVDLRATVRHAGADIAPYRILGVCNPALARRVLEIEPYAGLSLPCSVTLWVEDGAVLLTVASPKVMMSVLGDERLRAIAIEAETRLRGALARLVD